MKELRKPQENIMRLLGVGKKDENKVYKKTAFFVGKVFEDGVILYHTLLKSIAFISKEGYDALLVGQEPQDEEEKTYFYTHYFLVPEDTDECKTVKEIRGLLSLMQKKKGYTGFTILPTTDCNARCFYCYEAGCEKLTMSEKNADDVAAFIVKKCQKETRITLNWFGGEPLYNYAAIDRICSDLETAGQTFTSQMISNGYLFSEEMVARAKTLWRLKSVQITLDGTEPVYNARKNYIYQEGSAFKRVLNNIKLLEKAEIKVDVRLNLDGENANDIENLIETLQKEFKGSEFVHVYAHLLYQVSAAGSSAYDAYFKIRKQLEEKNMILKGGLRSGMKMNRCMADSDESAVILPDGRLFRCEHFNEALPSFGSIYDDAEDKEILAKWHQYHEDTPECATCFYYPDCLRLVHCPEEDGSCCAEQRKIKQELYLDGIEKTYQKIKEEKTL